MITNWDEGPDLIVVAPYLDVPLSTETLDNYIEKWTAGFCSERPEARGASAADALKSPAMIKRAGKTLMGWDTATCVRTDAGDNRYSKAFVAYRPATQPMGEDFEGDGLTIGVEVNSKNKAAAEKLLDQIVRLVRPMK